MAAATRAKRVDPSARITVLEAGREIGRGTCSLPYFLSGELEEKSLQARDLNDFEREGIEVRPATRATVIHPYQRKLESTTETFHYDRLIVSTGSRARCTRNLGLDPEAPGVWRLRTIADVRKIKQDLQQRRPRRVAVIGGGYVGLEAAEALCHLGVQVTLFHRDAAPARLAPSLAEDLVRLFLRQGVEIQLNSDVEKIDLESGLLVARTPQGETRGQFDAFLTASGIEPETTLLKEAGASTGPSGAIKVNSRGETSLGNVYACGDGVEVPNPRGGVGRWVPLATTAARLGRVCGENAAGGSRRLGAIHGALAVRLFSKELGMVGLPQEWTDCRPIEVEWGGEGYPFPSRGPGRCLLFEDRKTGRFMGMQALAPQVSGLVDLASLCLEQELTVQEMQDLDCAYTPPLSALWHPFYLAARKAEKSIGGRHELY